MSLSFSMRRLMAALALGLALLPEPAMAAANARSAAMAGVHAAFADDADAMLANPALLAAPGASDRLSFTLLPNLNLGLGNNVLSFGELAGLLSTQTIESADVERVLQTLPPTGWRFLLESGTSLAVALPSSRTGIFLNASVDSKGVDIPRDLIALALNGNASVPNVNIASMRGATATAAASLGSSFAFPLGESTSMGMNLRYVRGLAYGKVREARGSLLSVDAAGRYSANAYLETEWATGGNGIATDLGLAGVLGDRLHWGAVLGNVGLMTWSQVEVAEYSLNVAPFSIVEATGSLTDVEAVTRDAVEEKKRQEGAKEMALPPYVRVAAAFRPWQSLLLSGEFQFGLADGFGVSTMPELRLGSEFRLLDWLPLRGGLALGGDRGITYATGLGLDMPHVRLDLAMTSLNGVGSFSRGAVYTLSNTFKF